MPIKVPIERAYYFEITPLGERIYYCIPKEYLEKMVQRKEVKENILKDYPDGLDIEVSSEKFEEFKKLYNLDLDVDPNSLLETFHSLLLKMEESFPKSGYINKNYLDKYLKDPEIKKLDRKIPFQEQSFSQVRMSQGEEPFDAFSKIQQSKGKER